PMFLAHSKGIPENRAVERILRTASESLGLSNPPENWVALSRVSFDLINEHLRENVILLASSVFHKKYVYLIATSVSMSINDPENAISYLDLFFRNGGTWQEFEDAIAVSLFATGNRVLESGIDILREMASPCK
ncbi:MAG: hypothetical protein QXV22_00275, partial [Thermoplasmataceae archaeon]